MHRDNLTVSHHLSFLDKPDVREVIKPTHLKDRYTTVTLSCLVWLLHGGRCVWSSNWLTSRAELKKLVKVHYSATLCTENLSRSHPGLSLTVCSNKPVLMHCLIPGTVKQFNTAFHPIRINQASPSGMGVWPLTCWDCGFKSHRWHGWMSVGCSNNPLHLQWVDRK
jgi:hypothetical protein